MIHSMEVRWFFNQSPFAVTDLFPQNQTPVARTDWYQAASSDGCSIKIRAGSLMETKLRRETPGILEWDSATGQQEAWSKWSLPFREDDAPHTQLLAQNNWIEVIKNRYLRLFSIHDEKLTEASIYDNHIDNGCLFELTSLTVRGEHYWTVGFESFGQYDLLSGNLLLTTNHLFQQMPHEGFSADTSCGYPHWLKQFA